MHIMLSIWEYDKNTNLGDFALLTIGNENVSFVTTVRLDIKEAWKLAAQLEHYLYKEMEVTRNEELHASNYRIDNLFSTEGL